MLELFNCRLCGGELKPETDETYRCEHCGRIFIKTAEEGYVSSLKELFNEEKLERISVARQNLWNAMHERYINSSTCIDYARVLKMYLPRDYYANFAELANQDNDSVISKFLNDSVKEDMDVYADAVLEFMLKSLTAGTINAVCNYIDRAYSKTSQEYIKYINHSSLL
ncbi:MAG: hypothetical protein LUD72_02800 [Bacteroidales bacterium]|nr:hypothetical protein [Bacteroidales bacterium]